MSSSEKRQTPRIFPLLVSVEVTSIAQGPTRETCTIRNLSETGMMFESALRFNQWDILRLTFMLPDTTFAIRTEAIVIHVLDKGTYHTGVQFKSLAIAEHTLLRKFIASRIEDSLSGGQAG